MLCVYFLRLGGQPYDLRIVVVAFVVGSVVQISVPLTKTLLLIWPLLDGATLDESFMALRRYRPELIRCFFNSNLSGYLKFAINPGDIFLLGLFSSPAQVAIYGLAKQMAAPLAMLQSTIQTAITPEVSALSAKLQLDALRRLVSRYLTRAFAFGGVLAAGVLIVGHLLITHVLAADYKNSLPVFYCLVVAAWLLLVLLVFRPLALSLDLLRWHNAALLLSKALLAVVVVVHSLNALTLAGIQLAEAAILRPAFAALVWQALRQSVTSDQASTA
jgi:O-antigen/teichoic acid export membrane protein